MTAVCRTCSRVNPDEALYCYHDGVALGGGAQQTGPLSIGSRAFMSPFVFPSGRACRNFDELVLACDTEWSEARELLRQGFLEGFLGGLGRADLAQAARQALKATDPDRGLEDLLTKLPGKREPARLLAQPLEISLGQVRRDEERRFVLHLENQGMGLLYGSVAADKTAWLLLGEGAGSPRKVFQCPHEVTIPVQVVGKALRAGEKAQEGRLVIESNGGTLTVVVRAEVPIQPFPDGALAGARTPRQVAEKAKANPKGAAVLFEKGAVARWYESNGWTYPVQGPASSGLGAVQQFFEALGLVRPPKVEISQHAVELQGPIGASLEHVLQVQTLEKRPVYANATSGVPWLKVGRIHLGGRIARIPLLVPAVPPLPGERLQGQVHVTANGNQRFTVDVTLAVSGLASRRPTPVPVGAGVVLGGAPPLPQGYHAAGGGAVPMLELEAALPEVVPLMEPAIEVHPLVEPLAEVFPTVVPLEDRLSGVPAGLPPIPLPLPPLPPRPPARVTPPPRTRHGRSEDVEEAAPAGLMLHLAPVLALVLGLVGMVVHDLLLPNKDTSKDTGPGPVSGLISKEPLLRISFQDGSEPVPPGKPRFPATMRFGLEMLDKDGKPIKRLTYDRWGKTNDTCVRLDGRDALFGHDARWGEPRGRWLKEAEPLGKDGDRERIGKRSVWLLDDKIEVTQTVELEGEPGSEASRIVVAMDDEARTFTRWVDSLPSAGHDALLQLRAYGYAGRLDRLEAQLLRALETASVPQRARSVGLRVLEILARRRHESCLLLGDELACC